MIKSASTSRPEDIFTLLSKQIFDQAKFQRKVQAWIKYCGGVNQALNVVDEFAHTPLFHCIHRDPPDLESFYFLISQGAVIDVEHQAYINSQCSGLGAKGAIETVMDAWTRGAHNLLYKRIILLVILEAGADPNKFNANRHPLMMATDDESLELLFLHGADLQTLSPFGDIETIVAVNGTFIAKAHRAWIAKNAFKTAKEALGDEKNTKGGPRL